jgi:hypothetical protein
MYAEHVLRVPVDWSTLPSTGFGCLSEMYQTRKQTQIPYVAVPVWFRNNPTLLDDPESPIPANREPWSRSRPRKRRRLSADNELDRDLGAVFAQMEMIEAGEAMTRVDGADGVSTGPDGVLTGPDGVLTGADGPDGVLTGADGVFIGVLTEPDRVMARPDGVEMRGMILVSAQEQSKLLADVAAYKARISFLESKLAELGFTEDDDSVVWGEELFDDRVVEQPENQAEDRAPMPTVPIFPPNEADRKGKRQMTDLELWRFEERLDPQTTLQEQLDSALDWMNLADHFATALAFKN